MLVSETNFMVGVAESIPALKWIFPHKLPFLVRLWNGKDYVGVETGVSWMEEVCVGL